MKPINPFHSFGPYTLAVIGGWLLASPVLGVPTLPNINTNNIITITNSPYNATNDTTDNATANSLDDGYPSPAEAIYGTPSVYKGVYACDWPSGNWVMVTNGMRSIDAPAFVACATNRPDIVYTAGQASDWGWPAIYQSTNAGTNWTAIFNGHQNQNIQTGWEGNHGDLDWGYGGGVLGSDMRACQNGPRLLRHARQHAGSLGKALFTRGTQGALLVAHASGGRDGDGMADKE